MSFIYAIKNKTNGKMYIGKTEYTNPIRRFKIHLAERKKSRCKGRALYRALNQYGVENFEFQILEETTSDLASEREQYYIQLYDTYKNGYNETLGGDGTPYVQFEVEEILRRYQDGQSLKQIAADLSHDTSSIRKILIEHNIPIRRIYSNKPVAQIDPNTNTVVQIFESASAAEQTIPTGKHINQACKGSYKTAGGYKWEYYDSQKHIIHTPGI